jgi:hypothetical protein
MGGRVSATGETSAFMIAPRFFRWTRRAPRKEFWKEVQRISLKHGQRIGMDHAIVIANTLLIQSKKNLKELREAKAAGAPADVLKRLDGQIWVIEDGAYVRGYKQNETREKAISRDPNSLRNKLKHVLWTTKEKMETKILEAGGTFENARRRGIIVHDRKSDTWATADIAKFHVPPGAKPTRTPKQQEKWDTLGMAPGLTNDRDAKKSQLFAWLIAEGYAADTDEARELYDSARNCSEKPELIPIYYYQNKIFGKNFYTPGLLRKLPRSLLAEALVLIATKLIRHLGCDPDKLLDQGAAAGQVIKIDEGVDPFAGDGTHTFSYVGIDKYDAEVKLVTEVQRHVSTVVPKQSRREIMWRDELSDPKSRVSKTLAFMPSLRAEAVIHWIAENIEAQSGECFNDAQEVFYFIGWAEETGRILKIGEHKYIGPITRIRAQE